MKEFTCKICGKELKNIRALGVHIRMNYKMTLLDYMIKHEGFKIPKCEFCENDAKHGYGISFCKTCGTNECKVKAAKARTHSPETRQKLSKQKIKFYEENPHLVPYRIYNPLNGPSYPERYFRDTFTSEGIEFEQEVKVSRFRLDFVLHGKKINFEVDGDQHYESDGALCYRDVRRTQYLEERGWKSIRVRWSEWLKLSIEKRKRFIEMVKDCALEDINTFDMKPPRKRNKQLARRVALVIKRRIIIENSGIDLTEWGWQTKLSNIFEMSPQSTARYVKRYFPDLYIRTQK